MATKTKKPVRKASKTAAPVKKRLTKAQKLKREIARRNRAFEKAAPAERRVLIAQDVIAQIKAKRFEAEPGTWTDMRIPKTSRIDLDASFQETFLDNSGVTCQCCAVGSLFLGCTLFTNKIDNNEVGDNWALGDQLFGGHKFGNGFEKLFSRKQLGLIETAFEGTTGFFQEDDFSKTAAVRVSEQEITAAQEFNSRYGHAAPEKRLIAIMENIIQHKGAFKP